MNKNRITKHMSLTAGNITSGGKHYGYDWQTYQAIGGYHPKSASNPTPSDKAQENAYRPKVTEVYENVKVPSEYYKTYRDSRTRRG